MRMDKLTSKFQLALQDAQSLAVGRDHQFIEPVHLMAALLDQEGGTVRHLLRSTLGEALDRLPRVEGAAGDVQVSNDLARLLNVTDKLAQQRNDAYISSELFVLAALEDRGELGRLMHAAGAASGPVEQAMRKIRFGTTMGGGVGGAGAGGAGAAGSAGSASRHKPGAAPGCRRVADSGSNPRTAGSLRRR